MKILIVSQWYAPEPSFKPHELARALSARGHEITSLTGFPNYPLGRIYSGYHMRFYQRDNLDGIKVLRVPLYPSHNKSPLSRSLNYLSFATSSSLGLALCGKPDIVWVYSCAPSSAISAYLLKILRGVPFVYEIQDLWPENLFATRMIRSRFLAGLIAWPIALLEKIAYNNASAITVISPGFKKKLIAKGVPEAKINFIPNWVDDDFYQPLPPDENLAREFGFKGKFNIVFAGNMGLAQAMDNILEAAVFLRDLPQIRFVLIGDGVERARLQRLALERGLSNVYFIERQPKEKMASFFALADCLLVHLKHDPLFEITIPSKTVAYLACGKPILCCAAGDVADMVRQANAGLICPQQDPRALAEAVRKFFVMPENERRVMGYSGREAFLDKYRKSVLIERYEQLFKEIKK